MTLRLASKTPLNFETLETIKPHWVAHLSMRRAIQMTHQVLPIRPVLSGYAKVELSINQGLPDKSTIVSLRCL